MADSGLNFEIVDMQNNNETYSSLTDINNINLFTTSFQLNIESKEEIEMQKMQEVKMQMFVYGNEDDYYSEIIDSMFLDNSNRIIKQDTSSVQEQTYGMTIISGCVVLTMFFIVIYLQYRNKKFEKRKKFIIQEDD